jgi:Na+/H+-dicarboxylate symporter
MLVLIGLSLAEQDSLSKLPQSFAGKVCTLIMENPEPNDQKPDASPTHRPKRGIPLAIKVLLAVGGGAALGAIFRDQPIVFGITNEHLGQLGILVVKMLRTLAVPLVLFAILDAFLRTDITAKRGGKLILICLLNVSVAMSIGLFLMNTLRPGATWRGHMEEIRREVGSQSEKAKKPDIDPDAPGATLEFLPNLAYYVPKSIVRPFEYNNIISIVLLAVFGGAALRRVQIEQARKGRNSIQVVADFIEATYDVLKQMLEWVVLLVPYGVFGIVAQVISERGLGVFKVLWVFLAVILLGMAIHSLLYYPLMAWLAGGKSPREYLGKGADAVLTGLTTNSSLATVPITLQSLARMGVSDNSSRLAACIGTNLNNDGITLYEAMAALFLAQALGNDLGLAQQLTIVIASIMAGAGIAGIPEAGLIVLPLVLGAAGLPEATIAAAIPLIIPVDVIIARCRSGVNVLSDMVVAIMLDGRNPNREELDAPPISGNCEPTVPAVE